MDGDSSTNDTLLALASGAAGGPKIDSLNSEECHQLQAALDAVGCPKFGFIKCSHSVSCADLLIPHVLLVWGMRSMSVTFNLSVRATLQYILGFLGEVCHLYVLKQLDQSCNISFITSININSNIDLTLLLDRSCKGWPSPLHLMVKGRHA